MTEAEWQGQVVDLATLTGWRHLHVRRSIAKGNRWATTTNVAGWPDLLLWRPGRVVAAELKSQLGVVSEEQWTVLKSLGDAGVEVFVWRPSDLDEVVAVLGARRAA